MPPLQNKLRLGVGILWLAMAGFWVVRGVTSGGPWYWLQAVGYLALGGGWVVFAYQKPADPDE